MPLTTGELDRVRGELGYNLLNTGAQPYIGVHAVFEQVIQPYLREGADTTSSTVVAASASGSLVTLAVASATGIALHDRVAVDVDDAFEMATVRSIVGTSVGVVLKKAHAGTYPVTVDGGLVQVRECLSALYLARQRITALNGTGALKAVDEVQFYDSRQKSRLKLFQEQLEFWRDELASRLGIPRRSPQNSNGGCVALY
jgi:hypothetical protein